MQINTQTSQAAQQKKHHHHSSGQAGQKQNQQNPQFAGIKLPQGGLAR